MGLFMDFIKIFLKGHLTVKTLILFSFYERFIFTQNKLS
jgi:hypothetical protein